MLIFVLSISIMDSLALLYRSHTGFEPERITALSPSGSRRKYYRMQGKGGSFIAVEGTDREENSTFIYLASHFLSKGLNVPEQYGLSQNGMDYLQEDLGEKTLFELLASSRIKGQYTPEDEALLCKVVSMLPAIQYRGGEGLDYGKCYAVSSFDARTVDFDLNYFKYCFLKPSALEFNELRLQDDFDRLKSDLLSVGNDCFMYRDFQSRNVMIKDGEPYFIDFQGGRKGPCHYDLASFVWQARAAYPESLKQKMIDVYLNSLSEYKTVDRNTFLQELRIFVLFRMLQVLGAYGFRGRIERKAHFLASIAPAIANLEELISTPFGQYPYLCEVLRDLIASEKKKVVQNDGRLEVQIISFSFKKGLPEDNSGNGGGYVFDCRSVNNPGRYEQYRHLSGLDSEVQAFLEDDGGISRFLNSVFKLVDTHVDCYLKRGFTHLQLCFGCTGGQHRSVYSALRTAEHISSLFGASLRVHLIHRELGIDIKDFKH